MTTYSDDDCYTTSEDDNHKISLNIYSTDKVEFPELGLGLAGSGQAQHDDFSVSVPSWQHNWLFRQQGNTQARENTLLSILKKYGRFEKK